MTKQIESAETVGTTSYTPRAAVLGAVTALEGRWSRPWLDALRAAAELMPDGLEWEKKYGVKDRTFRLRTVRLDGERTVAVGKAEDGSFLIRCTRPEEDGTEHVEAMCLSERAMLAVMYLYAKFEDIPFDDSPARATGEDTHGGRK